MDNSEKSINMFLNQNIAQTPGYAPPPQKTIQATTIALVDQT